MVDKVNQLQRTAQQEIYQLEKLAFENKLPDPKTARRIKAIWVLSGTGTYLTPLTQSPSDQLFINKEWGQWLDRQRLDHAARIICHIASVNSGKSISRQTGAKFSENDIKRIQDVVRIAGPYLVYNGVVEQNQALITVATDNRFPIPLDRIFIPKAKIFRTLDQVKNLVLPPELTLEADSLLGIVTHAPHYPRVLRMLNFCQPIPGIKTILFPLVISDSYGEMEFSQMELKGVADYVSRNEMSEEPYPYETH